MPSVKTFRYNKLIRCLLIATTVGYTSHVYALGPQIFAGLNYANPASLNIIKKAELIIGGVNIAADERFNGSYLGTNSATTSSTNSFLPYGRMAYRLYPNIVVGLDVTQPLFTAVSYPQNSFISPATVSTYLRDTDFSPRISWQYNEKLALGFGLNFNNLYNAQINFAVPGLGMYTNKGDDWAYGFNAGLSYMVRMGTFAGLSYYSKIVHHIEGQSTFGPLTSNNFKSSIINPETFRADIVHFIRPNWLINGILTYSVWSPLRFTVLSNTATGVPITIPQHYYNNFDYTLATKYDFNSRWSGLGLIEYNPGFQPVAYNNPGLPSALNAVIAALGASYGITNELRAKLVYAHVWGKSANNLIAAGAPMIGHTHLSANVVDFSIVYDV